MAQLCLHFLGTYSTTSFIHPWQEVSLASQTLSREEERLILEYIVTKQDVFSSIGEELASETRVKCDIKIIVSICMVIITAIKTTKNERH